jgi:hypothetical protein
MSCHVVPDRQHPEGRGGDTVRNKEPYKKPKLVVHGDVKAITQGGANGEFLDADFPRFTPKGDLTFS